LDWWNYYTSLGGKANKSNICVQLQNIHLNLVQGGKLKSTSLYFEVQHTSGRNHVPACASERGEGREEWDLVSLIPCQGWGELEGKQSRLPKAVDLCSGLLASRTARRNDCNFLNYTEPSFHF